MIFLTILSFLQSIVVNCVSKFTCLRVSFFVSGPEVLLSKVVFTVLLVQYGKLTHTCTFKHAMRLMIDIFGIIIPLIFIRVAEFNHNCPTALSSLQGVPEIQGFYCAFQNSKAYLAGCSSVNLAALNSVIDCLGQ